MAKDKKSFLLYCDIISMVEQLPNDKAGELFKHILKYVNDKNPVTDDLIINISFEPIKQALKRDLKKYESICNRNKNNGLNGGRPKNPEEPKKPSGLFGNPEEPKKPDIDIDIDSDIDIDKEKNINSVEKISTPPPKKVKLTDDEKKEILRKRYRDGMAIEIKNLYPNPTIEQINEIKNFIAYWLEPSKSLHKMRYEMEKTWDTNLRLKKWFSNSDKFEQKSYKTQPY